LVGLGTDAMTNRMLEELRSALWVRHLDTANPSAGFLETCSLLLDGNRRIAARYWPEMGLGELREGGAADLIVVDYAPPTQLNEGTFLGHLLFGVSQAVVDTTVCAGRVLMADRRLELDLDEAELAAEARARTTALWDRF
jgi:cytosine/adenosine deaminase-related metal-dependent hydrolase